MPANQQHKIVGLIGANSPGGMSVGASNEWSLVIHFAAWRYPGMPVVERELRIEMPVDSRDQLDGYMRSLRPYQVIEVEGGDDGERLKRVDAITRVDVVDPELEAIAARLQAPVEIDHPLFGKLVYDRRYNWFSGHTTWNQEPVEITLACEDPDHPECALATADALFQDEIGWLIRVQDYAVARLLELKNDTWIEDDEEVVSRDEFISRMTLETIAIDAAGNFTFWHDDGDLFWGHVIEIRGDLTNGPTHAGIAG